MTRLTNAEIEAELKAIAMLIEQRAEGLSGEPPAAGSLRRRARTTGVPAEDLEAVAQSALEILLGLHEGSAGRYGLRPAEFESWRTKFGAASP